MKDTKLFVVLPCYNEEEVLGETSKRLLELYGKMISEGTVSPESKIVFVDDGSRDRTWEIISGLCEQNNIYRGVKLAHNAGHQNALLGGLMTGNRTSATVGEFR